MSVTLDDVRAAAALLDGTIVETPCRHSPKLSAATGGEVWVKYENLQFTGSFKDRGALVKLSRLTEAERARGVIAVSAGNHAQGVAYHASRLGIPALIVMPAGTPDVKVAQTEELGARALLEGEDMDEAARHAHALIEQKGYTLVHPFDDDAIIAGQGTVALEMLAAVPALETLVVPVGGGGLIAGCAIAAKALGPEVEVVGVEASVYPALGRALAGAPPPEGGQTLAEGIAVKTIGGRNLPIAKEHVDAVIDVGEPALETALALYLSLEKTLAEGAGAASLAALLTEPERFQGRKVGLVLSGGNLDPRLLASVIMRDLHRRERIVTLRIETADRPGALAEVARLIADHDGNIIEVYHQRLFGDVPAKRADLDVMVETRDAAHIDAMIAALEARGYLVRRLQATAA